MRSPAALYTVLSCVWTHAFVPTRPKFRHGVATFSSTVLDEIRAMKVAEIKQELTRRQIPTQDVFEKEELVQRLLLARQDGSSTVTIPSSSSSSSSSSTTTMLASENVIVTPLRLVPMDQGTRVASRTGGGGITIEASPQPYATMQITVQDGTRSFPLSLLIDTACSGFVLRPEVQTRYNLPSLTNPVTMTGAGGISQAGGLTQIPRFTIGNENKGNRTAFGPLPAAVQDIGGLPRAVDGIIGQSFLSQFPAFELDFLQGQLLLYRNKAAVPSRANETMIAHATMKMLGSLGICTVPAFIGGRGPVEMLVDTGAAHTLLTWKGVADLGLLRDSPQLSRIPIPTGAMGSDNVAIELSHRLFVSSVIQIGERNLPGLVLAGARLSIDIGQIPVINGMPGVGGILGADVLMRCDIARISCREPFMISLFQS
jgi:Aspartyl protease